MVGTVVALSVTRELGPVLTGLMVSGRVGSAMAAELGTMRVTEQIDALYTLATNPDQISDRSTIFSGRSSCFPFWSSLPMSLEFWEGIW